jgi:hypothetical protein
MTCDIEAELDALDKMTTGDLAERYAELHGQPCRTRHRAYLIRKIAWRMQANAEGDIAQRMRRIRERAAELANDADVRVMAPRTTICPPPRGESRTVTKPATRTTTPVHDPRLPATGAAIVREYKGRTIRAVVLDDEQGFECDGQRYRTLSALAKEITGSHMNGFRFFRLGGQR